MQRVKESKRFHNFSYISDKTSGLTQADEPRFNVIWSIHLVLIMVQAAASCPISYISQEAALFLVKRDVVIKWIKIHALRQAKNKDKLEMLKRNEKNPLSICLNLLTNTIFSKIFSSTLEINWYL